MISGELEECRPRPAIHRVTATNAGGKSSFFLSLACRGSLHNVSLVMCLNSATLNDAIVTFRTARMPDGNDWYAHYTRNPMTLRLTVLDPLATVLYQTSETSLEYVSRAASVPCGALLLDTWSSSPRGFPPATLCHWEGRPGVYPHRADIDFQGDATLEAETWYQFTLKMRIQEGTMSGTPLLRLQVFYSEETSDEEDLSSESFGTWTPVQQLPRQVSYYIYIYIYSTTLYYII